MEQDNPHWAQYPAQALLFWWHYVSILQHLQLALLVVDELASHQLSWFHCAHMVRLIDLVHHNHVPGILDKVEHHSLAATDPHMFLLNYMLMEDERWECERDLEHLLHIDFQRGRRECQWDHREVTIVEHLHLFDECRTKRKISSSSLEFADLVERIISTYSRNVWLMVAITSSLTLIRHDGAREMRERLKWIESKMTIRNDGRMMKTKKR